ncbi:MAG: lipid core--O antigen ligase-related protein [Deltaproteobacteria bacterium]|nr:lipid core--O antigen ligase-related protein [Deltaproteobacteria bacterium]
MGIATFFISLIRSIIVPVLYYGGILTCIPTIFRRAEWGFFLMIAMIPQPNIFYKFYDYPMGTKYLDLLFVSVLIGIFVNKKKIVLTHNSILVGLLLVVSYLALWNSSSNFSLPAPITTRNELLVQWKSYAVMIFMYFLALNISKDEKQHKIMIMIMAAVVLFVSLQSLRSFTAGVTYADESRYAGPFEVVELNSNHFGAFIVSYCSLLLGLVLFDKNKWRRLLFLAAVVIGIHPLFFSYSRGAYAAALGVLCFFGVVKKRSLLVLALILFISWQTLLPSSVVDRIQMTKGGVRGPESSVAVRLDLWNHAVRLFERNPIFGTGFGGFELSLPKNAEFKDTHNLYLKILSEQGVIGLSLLLLVFFMALRSGQKLYRKAQTPFQKGLGFGFLGCTVAFIVTNMFGDRWSYFVLGDYFWIVWGLVDREILMSDVPVVDSLENRDVVSG